MFVIAMSFLAIMYQLFYFLSAVKSLEMIYVLFATLTLDLGLHQPCFSYELHPQ